MNANHKSILAAAIGNFIEVYDYAHYMYFSTVLAALFFTQSNRTKALSFVFAIYAIERLVRPFVGVVMGLYVDKHGRSNMLNFSVIGMVLTSLLMCFIPTNMADNILIPLSFLIIRLCQGFFISSEFVTCMVYMTEIAPPTKTGLYGSIAFLSGICGTIVSSIIAFLVTYYLTTEQTIHWGWKIPYLVGLFLLLLSYPLRKNLLESPQFIARKNEKLSISTIFMKHRRSIVFAFAISFLSATIYSIFVVYMPAHLNTFKQLPLSISIQITTFNLCFYALLLPLMGWISDQLGKEKMIALACGFIILFSYPVYYLLNSSANLLYMEALLSIYIIFIAALNGPLPAFLSELFNPVTRATSMAMGFGVSLSLAGAIAPLICLHLPTLTNNINSPGIYIIICALIAFGSLFSSIFKKYKLVYDPAIPTLNK